MLCKRPEHENIEVMTDDVWLQLLDELDDQVPVFVHTFLEELNSRALYDTKLVSSEEIAVTADETMRMLIAHLRGSDTALFAFATGLGRRRARQGVPLERLIEAIRLDLRIIWQMLLRLAHPDRIAVLVQYVERLMAVLDEYIDDVQQAFLAEIAILQRDSRIATEQHLSKLFNATTLSPTLLHEVASGIGVDAEAEFEVVLFTPQHSRDAPQRKVALWLEKHETFSYGYRGWLLLFRERGASLSTWPREFAAISSFYVHRVSGLSAVASAARAAIELQAVAAEILQFTDIEELWTRGAEGYLNSLVPDYFRSILEAIETLPQEERDRVTHTVRAYLDSGSIKETAVKMNCHRNTVVNRLRVFQDLTGLDVTVPTKAALAVVLLSRADAP